MVKHADQPEVEVDIDIDAPPAVVWGLVSDVDLPARYSPEFQGAEWLDAEVGLGARFRGLNQHRAIGEWETTSTVIEYAEGRVFSWAVNDPDEPAAVWSFQLEPLDGGTRLTMKARMGPGRSGVTWAIENNPDREDDIVDRRLEEWRSNMAATVKGVKEMAEGSI